jgi:hypothetical protein
MTLDTITAHAAWCQVIYHNLQIVKLRIKKISGASLYLAREKE